MEALRGHTSGLAVPTYILNAPHGQGKTPILPDYLLWLTKEKAVLRTWENVVFEYPNEKWGHPCRADFSLTNALFLDTLKKILGRGR